MSYQQPQPTHRCQAKIPSGKGGKLASIGGTVTLTETGVEIQETGPGKWLGIARSFSTPYTRIVECAEANDVMVGGLNITVQSGTTVTIGVTPKKAAELRRAIEARMT